MSEEYFLNKMTELKNTFTWEGRCYDGKYDFDVINIYVTVYNAPQIVSKFRAQAHVLEVNNVNEEYDDWYDDYFNYTGHITANIEIREENKDAYFNILKDEYKFEEI